MNDSEVPWPPAPHREETPCIPATTRPSRHWRAGRCALLDLGAVPTAPGCARAWTRQILWEWRLDDLSEAAEGIVSELVTNAVLASRQLVSPVVVLLSRNFATLGPHAAMLHRRQQGKGSAALRLEGAPRWA